MARALVGTRIGISAAVGQAFLPAVDKFLPLPLEEDWGERAWLPMALPVVSLLGYDVTLVSALSGMPLRLSPLGCHINLGRCARRITVASYPGSYDEYVYRVQNEIDSGLRAPHTTTGPGRLAAAGVDRKARARADRDGQNK